MATFNSYEDLKNSNDVADLISTCKEGVLDNNVINDGKFSDWRDANHIAETYLEHNVLWRGDSPEKEIILTEINNWLIQKQREEEED